MERVDRNTETTEMLKRIELIEDVLLSVSAVMSVADRRGLTVDEGAGR